ncbi:hypothetical protein LA374_00575 [Aeromonas schubertii]|uniref:Uncharacterized protein n=1 Tax=Aeromonas schubertii TaxID=652 RepID=A0ABS7V6R1_9GAMM|nr:hypothetical protein [Aeromonas schubertii]MBZ6064713.1 hypothetical protein [Aeromonas schubertii]
MKHFARVVSGRVTEVWNDGGLGIEPSAVHISALAEKFEPCPDWVLPGATKSGDTWQNPPPIEKVEEEGEPAQP